MCLTTIKKTEVLKEDLTVWKVVYIGGYGEHSEFPFLFLGYLRVNFTSKRKHKAVRKWICYNVGKNYRAGFHEFLKKKDAIIWWHKEEGYTFRKYIFPKGAKVIFGKQTDYLGFSLLDVVVSPVLINPRVKEASYWAI